MPNVTAPTRQMGNGDVVTQFVDSVGTSAVTYTYPKTQEKFIVRNMGPSSLSVTIAGVTQVIQRGDKWQKVADFTSFSINAVSGIVAFDAWADEKGSTFDSAEGQYFATGVVVGGAGGIVFEALANGETVTIDNSAPPAIPATPTGLAANPQSTQVSLTWNAMSGATSYKLYRGGTLIASPTSASYVDTGLTNGTTYPYTVSSVNAGGESAQCSAVSATPVAPSLPATPTAPTATAGNAQVALTWGTVSGATGYKVYRGGTLIASPTATNYTDTGLTNGTAYSYTISATNAAGESPQSAATSATPALPAIPAVPTGLTATAGNAQVALTWNAMSGATSYKVYRGGTLLASPTTNSYTDTTAVNGTAYSYTVSSVNAGGESAQSSSVNSTPVAPTASVTDDFNRADSTTTMGTATTGQAWTPLSGTWGIIGNQAYCVTTTANALTVVESGKTDVTVQAKLATLTPTNTRIAFRVVDLTNMLIINTDTGSTYKLFKQVAGTFTTLATSTGVTATNGDVVKIVTSGSNITVFVNNVQVMTATCTDHQTATKHGLANSNAPTARYDDFSVV